MEEKIIAIKEVKDLLAKGKQLWVEGISGDVKITNYIEKGKLKTFKITLDNDFFIKVSKKHRFFDKLDGWVYCQNLKIDVSNLLCNDNKYHIVKDIQQIGFNNIVDISVQDESQCYFGNGILNHNSGKSLICGHLVKSCQQQDGIPVIIDAQHALDKKFLKAIGVDTKKVIIYQNNILQDIYKIVQELMYSVRLEMPQKPLLIIIDSITATVTKKDLENKDYQNKGYQAAIKAKMNSQALRKLAVMAGQQKVALVYTSQVRQKMDVMNPYMDPYVSSSGGMALSFYASSRIRLQKKSKLKIKGYGGVEKNVGVRTKARIDKSRLGPSNTDCEFDVYYDCGVDNYSNWLQTLKKYKVIEGKGTKNLPWIVKFEGQEIFIGNNFNETIRNDAKIREQVYDVLAEILILKYKNIEDVQGRQIIVEDDLQMQKKIQNNQED